MKPADALRALGTAALLWALVSGPLVLLLYPIQVDRHFGHLTLDFMRLVPAWRPAEGRTDAFVLICELGLGAVAAGLFLAFVWLGTRTERGA